MKKLISVIILLALLCSAACAETLTVAASCDFPPYEYYDDETGEIVGIEIEIVKAIAESLGWDVEIKDTKFASIIAAVGTGKFDMGASGFTVTEERKLSVDFTVSYTTAKQSIIVPEESPITTVDDLFDPEVGYRIGMQEGTTSDLYITDDVETYGLSHEIERYNLQSDAVAALLFGKLDCVIMDDQVAIAYVNANEGLKILDTEYISEDYAFCFPKGSEMYEPFNTKLTEMMEDGTVQAIIDKYISAD